MVVEVTVEEEAGVEKFASTCCLETSNDTQEFMAVVFVCHCHVTVNILAKMAKAIGTNVNRPIMAVFIGVSQDGLHLKLIANALPRRPQPLYQRGFRPRDRYSS